MKTCKICIKLPLFFDKSGGPTSKQPEFSLRECQSGVFECIAVNSQGL